MAGRRWNELLQEIRVILPGIQFIFAFLLTVPFSNRFSRLGTNLRVLLLVAIVFAAAAAAVLMAPGVQHRLHFRQGRKHQLVDVFGRLALLGSVLTALSMVCAIFVVCDVMVGWVAAVAVDTFIVACFGVLWTGPFLGGSRRGKPPSRLGEPPDQ